MAWLLSWLDRLPHELARELLNQLPQVYVWVEEMGPGGRLTLAALVAAVLERNT
jgi:hypothetical protein